MINMPEQQSEQFADFEKRKTEAELFYSNIGEVYCPYLGEMVIFNAKGREHLKFHARHKIRPRADQYIRYRILKYAPEIIRSSRTLQGLSKTRSFERIRSNNRDERMLTEVAYYEFVAIMDEKIRVRVIVKCIGASQPYFWSVIPFWKKDKDNGRARIFYGSPEDD
jgi:hypothetical protein